MTSFVKRGDFISLPLPLPSGIASVSRGCSWEGRYFGGGVVVG